MEHAWNEGFVPESDTLLIEFSAMRLLACCDGLALDGINNVLGFQ
jgi:hypothetical protein